MLTLSHSDKYYKTWLVGTWKYKLVFTPGRDTQVSDTEIELPPNFIFAKIDTEAGFQDGLSIGLPLASVLNLSLKMSNIYDNDYADWSTLRQWIYDGTTQQGTDYFNSIQLWSNNSSEAWLGSVKTDYTTNVSDCKIVIFN